MTFLFLCLWSCDITHNAGKNLSIGNLDTTAMMGNPEVNPVIHYQSVFTPG